MGADVVTTILETTSHRPESAIEMGSAPRTAWTRILIVDDHPLFCDGLQALLERAECLEVVAQAWTSGDALSFARRLHPELILLDIVLDNNTINGLDLVHQLRRICPAVKIAVLTAHAGDEYLMNALRLGVDAFLEKDLPPSALLTAIRLVRDGERVLPKPHHLTLALTELRQVMQELDRAHSDLNDQEIGMLRLAASGYNNKAIGAHEFWSEITVKRKMQVVYHKLGVSSRAQAVAEAIRLGFM
jgi:DNA-binding NarL/FixJ family response regulator